MVVGCYRWRVVRVTEPRDFSIPVALVGYRRQNLDAYVRDFCGGREAQTDYPSFWDEESEEFTGPVMTNAIEGGNWRLERELRVPYQQADTARGR